MRISFIIVLFIFISCSSKEETVHENNDIPKINLSEVDEEVGILPLSDVAKNVEIVKLETNNSCLIGRIADVKVTDNDIWIVHWNDQRVYRFSREGKFLNTIGKIGEGPDEYIRIWGFAVNSKTEEIYIFPTTKCALIYNYEGDFLREGSQTRIDELFSCYPEYTNFITFYDQDIILSQHLYLMRPTSPDSLWSLAWADEKLNIKKTLKNPSYLNREQDIIDNSHISSSEEFINYWIDEPTSIELYNNELTFKFSDTDTIYLYDKEKEEVTPQYIINSSEEKGDYGSIHQIAKDKSAFNYFTILNYLSSKDYLYLHANKGNSIYTYRYNKKNKLISVKKQNVEIKSRRFSSAQMHYLSDERFLLTNDINGGDFYVRYKSDGKYWIYPLELGSEDYESFIEILKNSPTAPQKQALLDTIEETDEDENPILLIAVLK